LEKLKLKHSCRTIPVFS